MLLHELDINNIDTQQVVCSYLVLHVIIVGDQRCPRFAQLLLLAIALLCGLKQPRKDGVPLIAYKPQRTQSALRKKGGENSVFSMPTAEFFHHEIHELHEKVNR